MLSTLLSQRDPLNADSSVWTSAVARLLSRGSQHIEEHWCNVLTERGMPHKSLVWETNTKENPT